MRIITTLKDLEVLKKHQILPKQYISFLQKEFYLLYEELNDDESIDDFSLRLHGPMVVVEKGDNNFRYIGLDGPLLHSHPEYVDRYDLKGIQLYRIGICHDNDYMILLYSEVGIHDTETENWLQDELANNVGGYIHGRSL